MIGETNKRAVKHGGGLTDACRRYGGHPDEWLDLSTGINPQTVAMPAISSTVWQRLPDNGLFDDASHAAAGHYGVSQGVRPLPVAGAQSAIQLLPRITTGPVAIVGPTYEEYAHCFECAGRSVELISDLSGVQQSHMVVIVVNPNNPDGRTHRPQELLHLADGLSKRGGMLVVDEAFAEMRPEISVAGHVGRQDGLIVLRSFGKFFGLAGLRLGFVLADETICEKLADLQGPWPVSGPALAVAGSVLRDRQLVETVADGITDRHKALKSILSEAGLAIAGGTDLFLLVEDDRAQKLYEGLCQCHILTRIFHYRTDWIRFGLCPDLESDQRLRRVLSTIR